MSFQQRGTRDGGGAHRPSQVRRAAPGGSDNTPGLLPFDSLEEKRFLISEGGGFC